MSQQPVAGAFGGGPRHTWTPEHSQLPPAVYQTAVETYRVVVHTMGFTNAETGRTENHWTIFLVLADHHSVQINFRVGMGAEDDQMVVSYRLYEYSNSGLQSWDFPKARPHSVRDALNCIYQNKRHQYRLDHDGLGCRYWVHTVMSDFTRAGLASRLSNGVPSVAFSHVTTYNYTKNKPPEYREMAQGTFY